MMRGCVRVSPVRTDVLGIAACPKGAVARCVSVADTSLSLSLSLSAPSSSPGLAPAFPGFSARIAGKVFLGHKRVAVRAKPGTGRAQSLAYATAYVRQAKHTMCCRARGGVDAVLTPAGSVEPCDGLLHVFFDDQSRVEGRVTGSTPAGSLE